MTCVLIRNVDDKVSEAVIAQKMMEFGIVTNVRVLKDRQGNSKGMGYVFYAEAKGANNACKHSGCKLGTKKMIIEPIKRKNSATSPNRTVKKAVTSQNSFLEIKENLCERIFWAGHFFEGK